MAWVIIFRIVAALIMLQSLFAKLSGKKEAKALFKKLNAEPTGRITIAIAELIASILLFIPGYISYGAYLTIVLMVGALFAHVTKLGFKGDYGKLSIMAVVTLVCGILALLI